MQRLKKPNMFLLLFLTFFILFLINLYLNQNNYMLTLDAWTVVPTTIYLVSLGGLNLAIFLYFISKSTIPKLLVILVAFVSFIIVLFFGLFSSERFLTYQSQGYVIYVKEYRFLFAGEDSFYIKENPFIARYIGSGDQGEECNTSYYIEDGVFYIVENWESGRVDTTKVPLK